MSRKLIFALIIYFPTAVIADLRHYSASLSDSQWAVTKNTPITCQLVHHIPTYGTAVFTSEAGRQQNMNFTLDMLLKPGEETQVELFSRAPQWRPGIVSKAITPLYYRKNFNGEVTKRAAWSMLAELDRGREPTFYYADWYNSENHVSVGLSVVNFARNYTDFKTCLARLLPYSFDDIAFTVLNYEEGGTDLTRFAKQQLSRVQAYLAHDSAIELVLIDGYTDSYGGRSANQRISEKRAKSVADFFVASGIAKERIVTDGYGERRHVASNDSSEERARNRRVVIRISKSLAAEEQM